MAGQNDTACRHIPDFYMASRPAHPPPPRHLENTFPHRHGLPSCLRQIVHSIQSLSHISSPTTIPVRASVRKALNAYGIQCIHLPTANGYPIQPTDGQPVLFFCIISPLSLNYPFPISTLPPKTHILEPLPVFSIPDSFSHYNDNLKKLLILHMLHVILPQNSNRFLLKYNKGRKGDAYGAI